LFTRIITQTAMKAYVIAAETIKDEAVSADY